MKPNLTTTPEIIDRCPGCQATILYRVDDGHRTNFLCRNCYRCWHVEDGSATQVHPSACPGCEWRPRCLSRWDATGS